MKTIGLIGLMGLMFACEMAMGRIGDSPAECVKRYDELPPRPKNIENSYGRNGVYALCRFKDGKCASIMYSLDPPGVVKSPDDKLRVFSRSQCMKLMELNEPSSKWVKVKGSSYGEEWYGIYETEDGRLHAKVSQFGVNVETTEYYREMVKQTEAAAVDATIESFGK